MNNFVDGLLDKQYIGKRRYAGQQTGREEFSRKPLSKPDNARPSPASAKPAFRPKGISTLFRQNAPLIEKIRQEPVKLNRRSPPPSPPKPVFQPQQQYTTAPQPEEPVRAKVVREKRLPFSSLSAVSVIAVIFLAMGILLAANSRGKGMSWADRNVVSLEGDAVGQHNLALYAGINSAENAPEAGTQSLSPEVMEAIPLDLTEGFAWQSYRVRKGDSVSKIAAAFSVSMDAIIASNEIANARSLREGEVLRIPNMDGIPHTVRSGDSLSGISRSFGVPLEAILDANDIQSDRITAGTTLFIPGARMNRDDLRIALGERPFIHPLRGARLSSPFGWRNDPISGVRRHHSAIDLAAPQGTPVMAARDGSVSAIGFDRTYGNFLIISHAEGFQTLYAHLHTILVKKGEQVRQGARIGSVGSTGYSTGPHLHFALFKNSRAVNPLDFLNNRN